MDTVNGRFTLMVSHLLPCTQGHNNIRLFLEGDLTPLKDYLGDLEPADYVPPACPTCHKPTLVLRVKVTDVEAVNLAEVQAHEELMATRAEQAAALKAQREAEERRYQHRG